MSTIVQQTTQATFARDVLHANTPVVVDFWAPWCGPCRMLAPELEKAAAQLGERAAVVKVNVDEHPVLAAQYGVMSIPTLIIFHQGKEIGRHTGFLDAGTLAAAVESYLSASTV